MTLDELKYANALHRDLLACKEILVNLRTEGLVLHLENSGGQVIRSIDQHEDPAMFGAVLSFYEKKAENLTDQLALLGITV